MLDLAATRRETAGNPALTRVLSVLPDLVLVWHGRMLTWPFTQRAAGQERARP
jgi:hypothetical protein